MLSNTSLKGPCRISLTTPSSMSTSTACGSRYASRYISVLLYTRNLPVTPCYHSITPFCNPNQRMNPTPTFNPRSKISCYPCKNGPLKLFSSNLQNLPWPSDVGFSHQHHKLSHHFSWEKKTQQMLKVTIFEPLYGRHMSMTAGVTTLSPHSGKSY